MKKRAFNYKEVIAIRDFICVMSFLLNPKSRKDKSLIGKFHKELAINNLYEQDYVYHVDVEWGEFFDKYNRK